ncbi:glycerate kinase [Arthrobacter sp. B6]|uniref:glycerate kinase n=1 Tax=Arthrobacter sp. B6 TaxID=1570137 RepID=UPI0018D3D0AD
MSRTSKDAARIVFAPDSLRGTATADAAARNIAEGWLTVRPNDDVRLLPMADGGEGAIDALKTLFPAAEQRAVRISGPDGRPVDAVWLYLQPTPGEPNGRGVGRTRINQRDYAHGIPRAL